MINISKKNRLDYQLDIDISIVLFDVDNFVDISE